MILTGSEITRQVQNKKISIIPFAEKNVNPNSYNYRLGNSLLEIINFPIDTKNPPKSKQIKFASDGYVLKPGRLYLANTYEVIGSHHYVTSLIGRSSVGRLGLFVQITADLGNLGPAHSWTLELKVVQPLRIYPQMSIGQVTFWQPKGEINFLYDGKYSLYSKPHMSEIYTELTSINNINK